MPPVLFWTGSRVYVHVSLDWDPPVYAFHIAGMTSAYHCAQLFIGWDRVLQTFCPGWLWTSILPISASQITRIISMSHYTGILTLLDCWQLLRLSLFLMTLTSLRRSAQGLYEIPLNWDLSFFFFFSTIRLGFGDLGKKTLEVKCHFYHLNGTCYQHDLWLIYFFGGSRVWTWDFVLAKWALYCLSHPQSIFPWLFWRWGLESNLPD
jgi:hypothetical protein